MNTHVMKKRLVMPRVTYSVGQEVNAEHWANKRLLERMGYIEPLPDPPPEQKPPESERLKKAKEEFEKKKASTEKD